MKVERTSGFTMRSRSRWRYLRSTLVRPCCFSGRGTEGLREHLDMRAVHGDLARLRPEHEALYAHYVADVVVFFVRHVVLFAHVVALYVYLYQPVAVGDVRKRGPCPLCGGLISLPAMLTSLPSNFSKSDFMAAEPAGDARTSPFHRDSCPRQRAWQVFPCVMRACSARRSVSSSSVRGAWFLFSSIIHRI